MKKIATLLMLCLVISACKKDEASMGDLESFEGVIAAGGEFEPVQKSRVITDSSSTTKTEDGQLWRCTSQTIEAKDGAGGDDGFPMFNPNANVIYPGSLLQGKSLRKATPDVIAVDRAGGTISYDIIDGNVESSFTVDEVSKSSITVAMNSIINNASGVIPANFSFNYTNIQSREQFALEVEADYENSFLELEGYLELNTSSSYSSYLVRLDQSYYTMSFDIPTNRSELFGPNVTPDDLSLYVGVGNPPVYVSDVTYGRTYYMLIESTSSSFDLEAGISGSFSSIASSGGGSVDASYLKTLDNLKIQVFAYGGEASSTLRTVVDASTLDSLVNKLADAGDIRSGKPVSYVVRSVYNNQIVSVQLANKYDVTECVPLSSGNTPPAFTAHWSGLVKDFGPIGAAASISISGTTNDPIALFNKSGNKYMLSSNNQLMGPYDISDLGDGNISLSSIGAGGMYTRVNQGLPTTSGTLLFDIVGNQYQLLGNSGSSGSEKNIGSFGGGGCPFNALGISSMAFCETSANPYTILVVNKSGDQFSLWDVSKNNGSWSTPQFLDDFDPGMDCPFDYVGAVCYKRIGSLDYNIFFNKQGTQYSLWEKGSGFTPVYDL